ncbi:MAG: protein-L-isoaspartate(D-aspartate) O-methyltransferase [Gammaproteobacteria bacterium]
MSGLHSQRARHLAEQLRARGIRNHAVLAAIQNTPRHRFIEEALAHRAYDDIALPIDRRQTISQPFIVALMSEMLLAGGAVNKALEIGTGCGYQTALLAQLTGWVFSIERIDELQRQARELLAQLGYHNISYLSADGAAGWESRRPFDGILVTAAPREVPPALPAQLAPGGRLVIPVGAEGLQQLRVITRGPGGFDEQRREVVRFVPMLPGRAR